MALAKPCSGAPESSQTSGAKLLTHYLRAGSKTYPDVAGPVGQHSWFAVFTRSHHEKKISHYFTQLGIENFLPLYSQVHYWTNRRKVTVQLPLFPNYVFVHIDISGRGQVLRVPGVLSIAGRGYEPSPLPDFEMESLRSGLQLRKYEPHPFLVVGTRVRINVGPLEGMEGVLVRNRNNLRVVLTVALINQSVAVEVDADDVAPVHRQSAN